MIRLTCGNYGLWHDHDGERSVLEGWMDRSPACKSIAKALDGIYGW